MKREEENSNGVDVGSNSKFPLSFWEVTAASTVVVGFLFGLLGVYLTMPASDYSFLKLPRNLEDLQILRYNLSLSLTIFCKNYNFILFLFLAWIPYKSAKWVLFNWLIFLGKIGALIDFGLLCIIFEMGFW